MGEVRRLRWEHVNLEAGIIQLPESKNLKDPSGTGHRIVMQKELIDLLRTFPKKSGDWVFVKEDGLPFQHWDIHKPFKALLKTRNRHGQILLEGHPAHYRGAPPSEER